MAGDVVAGVDRNEWMKEVVSVVCCQNRCAGVALVGRSGHVCRLLCSRNRQPTFTRCHAQFFGTQPEALPAGKDSSDGRKQTKQPPR